MDTVTVFFSLSLRFHVVAEYQPRRHTTKQYSGHRMTLTNKIHNKLNATMKQNRHLTHCKWSDEQRKNERMDEPNDRCYAMGWIEERERGRRKEVAVNVVQLDPHHAPSI